MKMGQWRPHSTLPGVVERYLHGEGTAFHRQKVQDVAPIIKRNRAIANDLDGRTPGGGRQVGEVPATVFYDWIAEWTRQGLIGPGNMDAVNSLLKAKLRDGDFSKFRTTHGGI